VEDDEAGMATSEGGEDVIMGVPVEMEDLVIEIDSSRLFSLWIDGLNDRSGTKPGF
jgi:hypothetical protein